MATNTELIKQLRELTGAGVLDCKKTLDETNVVFGDQIRLASYSVVQEPPDRLKITLCWQAVHRIERDYKIFVHLTSSHDGAIAAQ